MGNALATASGPLEDFKPTVNMIAFADYLTSLPPTEKFTVAQCCRQIGVTAQAFQKWQRRYPNFKPWLRGRIAEAFGPSVYRGLAVAASDPDAECNLAASKTFLALFEGWSERVVVESHTSLTVTVEAGETLAEAVGAARQLAAPEAIDVVGCVVGEENSAPCLSESAGARVEAGGDPFADGTHIEGGTRIPPGNISAPNALATEVSEIAEEAPAGEVKVRSKWEE